MSATPCQVALDGIHEWGPDGYRRHEGLVCALCGVTEAESERCDDGYWDDDVDAELPL